MKTYFIADLHFGDEKCAEKRGFKNVAEHDEFVLDKVMDIPDRNKSRIVLAGDIFCHYESIAYALDIIDNFSKVIWVCGNHDIDLQVDYEFELEYGRAFPKRRLFYLFNELIVTHMPVTTKNFPNNVLYNIHGHLHTDKTPISTTHYNVGADIMQFEPIEYEDLLVDLRQYAGE